MSNEYLSDITKEDLKLSQEALGLLQGKRILKFRYDSKQEELFIEFDDGTRLFINHIQSKNDISIC